MKLAVIQHALRDCATDDLRALVAAVRLAAARGAEVVVLPEVPSVNGDGEMRRALDEALANAEPSLLVPYGGSGHEGAGLVIDDPTSDGHLGSVAVLVGDAVFDREKWEASLAANIDLLVVCPRSESELQAEAALELAIGFSDSLAGLVLVAECDGADVGEPGHGGSAIIALGEVVAEALMGDDVLLGDISVPIARPEPREPLPELPTLLVQRVANHHGAKVAVGYPADLTNGPGLR